MHSRRKRKGQARPRSPGVIPVKAADFRKTLLAIYDGRLLVSAPFRELRTYAGVSLVKVADELGDVRSLSWLYNFELGRAATPDDWTFRQVRRAYDAAIRKHKVVAKKGRPPVARAA